MLKPLDIDRSRRVGVIKKKGPQKHFLEKMSLSWFYQKKGSLLLSLFILLFHFQTLKNMEIFE